MQKLLEGEGFCYYHPDVPWNLAHVTRMVEFYERWDAGLKVSVSETSNSGSPGLNLSHQKRLYIMFAVCRKGPLHTILSSGSTTDMNTITSDTVLCFYLHTTLRGEGIEVHGGRHHVPSYRTPGSDIAMSLTNKDWTCLCGVKSYVAVNHMMACVMIASIGVSGPLLLICT
jgi:hypothetical protein